MYVMQFDNHIYMCTVSLTIIVYTHCVINLQQVRWNCLVHEEEGSSAVMLQSVIFCSPPLQSTVSLPIFIGLSAKMAELQRQQQEYKNTSSINIVEAHCYGFR